MKNLYSLFLLIILLLNLSLAQTVSTLVNGPSTFNDGLDIDKDGNIYASDYYGSAVTKITPSGETSIFANIFGSPNGLKIGPDGYLYVPSNTFNKIHRVSLAGEVEDYLSIQAPSELYFDDEGLLYVTSYTENKIFVVDQNKNIMTLFSGGKLDGPIGVLKDKDGILYIGNFNDGRIFKLEDGQTFTEIAQLPGWLGFMIFIDDYIYATAYEDNRIYKIDPNGGGTSVFVGTGRQGQRNGPALNATLATPNGITATSTGDTLYVSEYVTRSLRMVTGVTQIPTSVETIDVLPRNFSLSQNYPNPFNPSTRIQYTIPQISSGSTLVKLSVFDVLGKKVKTLVNENQSSGRHYVEFNADNLISGMYFYTLEAGDIVETKKMLLIK